MKRYLLIALLRFMARCGHSRSRRRLAAYTRKKRGVVERDNQADADAVVNPAEVQS